MTRRRCHGFTLLEVLVALAILAIALGALVKAAGDNAGNAAYLRDRSFAHWVAMNQVVEIEAEGRWPGVGIQRGTAEMAGREWYWNVKVSETPDEDMRRLDVEVRLREEQSEPVSALVAYLGRPPAGN